MVLKKDQSHVDLILTAQKTNLVLGKMTEPRAAEMSWRIREGSKTTVYMFPQMKKKNVFPALIKS